MSNPNGESDDEGGSTSPILFEDSQTSTENASMEVLGASRNDSKETNVGTEIGQSSGKNEADSESQDFMSPQRPMHNLFSSQQSYLSTSSPLRYPSSQSPLSLSRSIKSSKLQLKQIEEDSPNVSLTHVDDMGSFGSLSGVSEHGTPADNKSTVKKRKAADLSCSDSEVEVICEKSKDGSQEEHVRKKPRESVEFLRYASTPHRSSKAPFFQASDVSDEAINLRSIPEEDTADDLMRLHYSPSQDVDMPINSGSISAHSKKPVEAVQKLNLISQEESPDAEKNEPNSSSTDSNSIFTQVNKIAEGADGSSGSSLEITAVKAKLEDSEDTFPIDGSDDPSAGTNNKNDSHDAKRKESDNKQQDIEGYIYTKILYNVSEDGKSMENVRILWQMPVLPEIVHDTSSSLRSLKSLSPVGHQSDSQIQPLQPEQPMPKCARYSMSSSSSSSSGGSMLPPRLPRIPQEAFKTLHKPLIFKKDPRFCAEGLLQIIPPQIKPSVIIPIEEDAASKSPAIAVENEKENGSTKLRAKKSSSTKSKTYQRGRRKGSSTQKSSSSKKSASSNGPTSATKQDTARTANRRRKLNGTSSGQTSPEPLPDAEVKIFKDTGHVEDDDEILKKPNSESGTDNNVDDLETGQLVFAKWTDDLYYPGKLGEHSNGKWDVRFDDGLKRQVLKENVIQIDVLPIGQPIHAKIENQTFYPGIIYFHVEGPDGIQYTVELDKEGQHTVMRSHLCMDQAQVNLLRRDTSHNQSLTTPTHGPDVSLDNMVEGKRSRSKRQLQMDSPSIRRAVGRTRSAASAEPKPSCSRSLSHRSTSSDLLDSLSDSQSETHKLWLSDWENIPGVEESSWPAEASKFVYSKNKSNSAKEKLLGPIPQKKIFKDFIFCLSYAAGHDSESPSEMSGRDSELDSQDADSDRDDGPPFDRMHLIQQLTKGGGTVLEFFDEHNLKESPDKCLMITNRCNTTSKSIMCLALGVRSIRFTWVVQCCMENKLLSHKSYLLPKGHSLNPRKRIEWSLRTDDVKPFYNTKVALVSSVGQNFLDFWKKIFILGKATTVLPFMSDKFLAQDAAKRNILRTQVEIIVTDNESKELVKMADELKLPLVRTTWAVQRIICGASEPLVLHQVNNIGLQNLSRVVQSVSNSQEV